MMTVGGVAGVAAATVLLVAANIQAVRIERLLVPPLVELGSRESFLLDCEYRVEDTSDLTVQWFFKPAGNLTEGPQLVYRWTPPQPPEVRGVLVGKITVDPQAADAPLRSRLRVTRPHVELSGEYTCAVTATGGDARQTRSMLVYSEEHDMKLWAQRREEDGALDLSCSVKQVYPEPDLRLERFDSPIPQQYQRVQESDMGGGLLDALTTVTLSLRELRAQERFVCRLVLKQTPYQAMKELVIKFRESENIVERPVVTAQPPPPVASTSQKKDSKGNNAARTMAATGTLILAATVLALAGY